jgi:hypothetical protein
LPKKYVIFVGTEDNIVGFIFGDVVAFGNIGKKDTQTDAIAVDEWGKMWNGGRCSKRGWA